MRTYRLALSLTGALVFAPSVSAQTPAQIDIDWKVENRFRFFRYQDDFDRHVAKHQAGGAPWRSVLEVERDFMDDPELHGRGWAHDLAPRIGKSVGRLCAYEHSGLTVENCDRFSKIEPNGKEENYVNPRDHVVTIYVRPGSLAAGAQCRWTIAGKTLPAQACALPVTQRIAAKKDVSASKRVAAATSVSVVAQTPGKPDQTGAATIQVRDVMIVGMGDSIASGEGNPYRPVGLTASGFCFNQIGGFAFGIPVLKNIVSYPKDQYFRPGRANFSGLSACPLPGVPPEVGPPPNDLAAFEGARARWLSPKCHRSVYGYQMRTALALAVKHEKISVTYLPLGCTGATIPEGILGGKKAREMPLRGDLMQNGDVAAQIVDLRNFLFSGGKKARDIDALLLTIGANDIGFAELVAHTLLPVDSDEYVAMKLAKAVVTPEGARKLLKALPKSFATLREKMSPLLDGDFRKVVYVPYGNPGHAADGSLCQTTVKGFDVHPAFELGGPKLAEASKFVEEDLVPTLRKLAACDGAPGCKGGEREVMRFADGHRKEFARHGICAVGDKDPAFDKDCFYGDKNTFLEGPEHAAMTEPLVCKRSPAEFRPYRSRARWQRTVNDSYFAAMTFPSSAALKPLDIHNALWGLYAAVYGGAVHPTSEGHAAMADAALPHLEAAVGLK
jgi:hypothetical protein